VVLCALCVLCGKLPKGECGPKQELIYRKERKDGTRDWWMVDDGAWSRSDIVKAAVDRGPRKGVNKTRWRRGATLERAHTPVWHDVVNRRSATRTILWDADPCVETHGYHHLTALRWTKAEKRRGFCFAPALFRSQLVFAISAFQLSAFSLWFSALSAFFAVNSLPFQWFSFCLCQRFSLSVCNLIVTIRSSERHL